MAGARHEFSRAVRRVERRDVVDALCGRGVVMRRAGTRGAIASRPARRFADDDRSDLVVVTCFCLVSECITGGPGDACPRRGWAQTSAGGRVSAISEPCGGVGTSANPTHLGVWRLFFVPLHLREDVRKKGIAQPASAADQLSARTSWTSSFVLFYPAATTRLAADPWAPRPAGSERSSSRPSCSPCTVTPTSSSYLPRVSFLFSPSAHKEL